MSSSHWSLLVRWWSRTRLGSTYLNKVKTHKSLGHDRLYPQVLRVFADVTLVSHCGEVTLDYLWKLMMTQRGSCRLEDSKFHFCLQEGQERSRNLQASHPHLNPLESWWTKSFWESYSYFWMTRVWSEVVSKERGNRAFLTQLPSMIKWLEERALDGACLVFSKAFIVSHSTLMDALVRHR